MHSLKKLGTGGSAPAQPTTMGAARAFGPGRQPCGGGDCLVLSDSFLSFSANKKSTRRDSNPRPSPWQGDTPPLSHSCISVLLAEQLFNYFFGKHETGFEPATRAMARRYSTTEPLVHIVLLVRTVLIILRSLLFVNTFFHFFVYGHINLFVIVYF